MFNSLTGIITGKFPQKVYINTHGIEWDISIPESSIQELPPVGECGKVYTWMQHTDALMVLYGFASETERSLFFDLLKVDGIGPKGALKIMGNVTPAQLVSFLDDENLEALQKVPGVGKKTAAKMLLQLKGKLSLEALDDNGKTSSSRSAEKSAYADVVNALVNMGYERRNAEQTVSDISQAMEQDSSFKESSQSAKEDLVFRKAIVELAQ